MKFVIAPDKFKGSLNGFEFCDTVEKGIRRVYPNAVIVKKPLADGGDGTIAIIQHYLKASEISVKVKDPLFNLIQSNYLYAVDKKIAFIEMSEASGYRLLNRNELNCRKTTSLGTGELIKDALDKGAQEIILGIGGSATNDGGMGIAVALGYEFLDENGNALEPIGENLIKVQRIIKTNMDQRFSNIKLKVACDVDNPFYGPNGAAHVYAPQKGASKEDVIYLDEGLRHFAQIVENEFDITMQNISGAGAAGGVGGGAVAFLNASLHSGIELVKEIADFESSIKYANWILTGEGKLDNQTLSGKTILGVVNSAKKNGIPVAAFCGAVQLTPEEQENIGLTYVTSVLKEVATLDNALLHARENLEFTAFNFAKLIKNNITLV